MSTTQQTLAFYQRRLQAIQTDINDVTAMYLQAQSTKNIALAERCEATLYSANKLRATTLKTIQQLSNYPRVGSCGG